MRARATARQPALAVAAGMLAGSYVFAELSRVLGQTVEKWCDRGILMLPEVARIPRSLFVPLFPVAIALVLSVIEKTFVRQATHRETGETAQPATKRKIPWP
ncbi:MAG TPA: hypothetical protein VGA56_23445 [Opitutaceae bacterium]